MNTIYDIVDIDTIDVVVEPSAGTGSFFNLMDASKSIGMDLDPKYPNVIAQDYFSFAPITDMTYIVIGNPPFGKNSSLAIKFFNHSEYAQYIGFVVPKTFRKKSVQNRLDPMFHLIHDNPMPKDSFIFEGKPYDVPCCFQIWEKRDYRREKHLIKTQHTDFDFVNDLADTDFIIQRVGANAGAVKVDNLSKWKKPSHYYIKANIDKNKLVEIFNNISFEEVKYNTAGNPSISKDELIELYELNIIPLILNSLLY